MVVFVLCSDGDDWRTAINTPTSFKCGFKIYLIYLYFTAHTIHAFQISVENVSLLCFASGKLYIINKRTETW